MNKYEEKKLYEILNSLEKEFFYLSLILIDGESIAYNKEKFIHETSEQIKEMISEFHYVVDFLSNPEVLSYIHENHYNE